jgi:hypothetical protein
VSEGIQLQGGNTLLMQFVNSQKQTSWFTEVFSNGISYIKGRIMLSKIVEIMCNKSATVYHHETHFQICSKKPQKPQYN